MLMPDGFSCLGIAACKISGYV